MATAMSSQPTLPSRSLCIAICMTLSVVAGPTEPLAQDHQTSALDGSVANAIHEADRIYVYTPAGERIVGTRPAVSGDTIKLWVKGAWTTAVVFNAGLGALIGVAMDAGEHRRQTVYLKTTPPSAPARGARSSALALGYRIRF